MHWKIGILRTCLLRRNLILLGRCFQAQLLTGRLGMSFISLNRSMKSAMWTHPVRGSTQPGKGLGLNKDEVKLKKRNDFLHDENGLQIDPEISKLKYVYYKRQIMQTYNIILEERHREMI